MLIKRLFEASWGGHPVATRDSSFNHKTSRRAVLRLVGASAAFGLLAACSPAPTAPAAAPTQPAAPKPTTASSAPAATVGASSAAAPPPAQAAQAVKTGGTLTFGQ